jgi:hypothetical protein
MWQNICSFPQISIRMSALPCFYYMLLRNPFEPLNYSWPTRFSKLILGVMIFETPYYRSDAVSAPDHLQTRLNVLYNDDYQGRKSVVIVVFR